MTNKENVKENAQEIIKVKAFEMIELPIMDSDKTFMGKVAITNNGDYLRISDVYTALDVDSILGKFSVFKTIDVNRKAKLSDEPEDETGFFIHLDSFNDDELYNIFNKHTVEWLKTNILPRITSTSEVENNEEKPQEDTSDDYNKHFENLLKSIDNRLSKIEKTLSELLEEDEDTEDDTDSGSGIDDIDFADFLNNTFGKGNNLLILKRVKK